MNRYSVNETALSLYNPAFVRRARQNTAMRRRAAVKREAKATLIQARPVRAVVKENPVKAAARQRLREHMTAFERIVWRIVKATGVSCAEITGGKHTPRQVKARQAVMYWASRRLGLSLTQIGKRLGGRDHTTILHGIRVYPSKRLAMGRHLKQLPGGKRT